jgi:hypothetical protein
MSTLIKGSPHITSTHPRPGKLTKSAKPVIEKHSAAANADMVKMLKDELAKAGGGKI